MFTDLITKNDQIKRTFSTGEVVYFINNSPFLLQFIQLLKLANPYGSCSFFMYFNGDKLLFLKILINLQFKFS